MSAAVITVFGGSGYLGSAIVRALLKQGSTVRVATRHPGHGQLYDAVETVQAVQADVRDTASVEAALAGASAAINAVGLYMEKGADTFESVHVRGAGNVARLAARAGVERLTHISGIGTRADSTSTYVRARAAGELSVIESYPDAAIVRPSVLFGPGDSFLSVIDQISRYSPLFPLFGRGDTKMQPVYVDDVASAVARILEESADHAGIIELGGPQVYTYREIIEAVLHHRHRRRVLLPIPFRLWTLQARLLSLLPNPPLTGDQVILMRDDNIVGEDVVTFEELGITPRNLEALLGRCFGQLSSAEEVT